MEQQMGFLYVLANSAMPGVVKVGKTTRSPAERASELSGATGLPTPFIVVYEQLFEDCGAAELFVHTYLGQQGYRLADNREFFNAPANLVVKAISLAPGAISDNQHIASAPTEADDLLPGNEPDELDGLSLTTESESPNHPWESVFMEAEYHYWGLGEYIQDHAEAMRLFRQAAQLGSLQAYVYLGKIHENGEGVRENKTKALDFYKEGARRGNVYCYWKMGELFRRENNQDNSDKCFSLFIKNMPTDFHNGQKLTEEDMSAIYLQCALWLVGATGLPSVLECFVMDNYTAIRECIIKTHLNVDGWLSTQKKMLDKLDAMEIKSHGILLG